MDIDLDYLDDGPNQAPARASRYAPKGAKSHPDSKPKPKTEPPSVSQPASKNEEVDVKPEIEPEHDNDAAAMYIDPSEKKLEVAGESVDTELAEVEVEQGEVDEVVREIDVYFSPSVDEQTRLYLFQFPLRQLWRPYELDERCEEVRVKQTSSSEVEIDLTIDVGSENYDNDADPRLKIKKQTLVPSWKPPQTNGYTIGVLTRNKLHLNPIHAAVQFRPSMRHLSETESKKKTVVSKKVNDVVKIEEQQEAKASGMSRKQKAPGEAKDSVEESWIPLKYHSVNSGISEGHLQKMIARQGPEVSFSMSSGDYLNSLCPGSSGDSLSSKVPLRRSLLEKPLKERFETWLLEGPPLHRFDTLMHVAPDQPIEEVLAVLQELAVLVQGLWVPRTTLYAEFKEGVNGLARNIVLLLFSKDVIIKDDQIHNRLPALAKAMNQVLPKFATRRPTFRDWKLKELPDSNFIKLYPAIVKKQQENWETLEKNIDARAPGGKNGPVVKPSDSSTQANPVEPKGSIKPAAGMSSGSTPRNVMSEEDRKATRNALLKIFKINKTCSFEQISQRLREMAIDNRMRSKGSAKESETAANSIVASPHELREIISEVAVNIHGICVPKSSPDHPEYDDLRKVVIDLFLAKGPDGKLRKAHIIEAANMKLKDVSETAYKKVLQELCVSQGSEWVVRNNIPATR
ncbi:DNA-directed RNA polymerase III subunit RPC5-like isoform X1 [Salvia splendens]|uniref:DNA-directed RNA polymerase III subunit RPC5-like isoform X1 n=1 Tax=Salvia splendens TaxID=180675 RepID=UPI001C25C50C|nr:DNA-directed RNA polymerase III subunit RPC5-like isoform X1 [Salvia splendens]